MDELNSLFHAAFVQTKGIALRDSGPCEKVDQPPRYAGLLELVVVPLRHDLAADGNKCNPAGRKSS
jgi:hypothetical protein